MIKLDLSTCTTFKHHRYGWKYCINQLKALHSKSGIFCDGYIEHTFVSNKRNKSYHHILHENNWIGFMHNPPNGPLWLDKSNCCDYIIHSPEFLDSINTCKCIITLSKYLGDWLSEKIKVPIINVKYATNIKINHKWSVSRFIKQKHIPLLQIGYWLRNIQFIRDIECSARYSKIWIPSSYDYAKKLVDKFAQCLGDTEHQISKWRSVSIPKSIDDKLYDDILCRSIVCLDLYDTSANTSVLECIATNTPMIINKLPAVVEYLGDDYPLYFSDKKDVPEMLSNIDLIIETNKYLQNLDKSKFTGSYFCRDLNNKLENIL